ncbi:hypothetical protein IWW37_002881 [Coemansia sp. RSA 2050]|nr:hypothetical protein IWW37_002881 [Coemansia sp. RSA 2050]KAJ2733889.1 hypothetical protein IW152_002754 [Coemansia sp. BCRC 34962]
MLRFSGISLLALSCAALFAAKALADELEDVVGDITPPSAETLIGSASQVASPQLVFSNYKAEAFLLSVAVGLVISYFYGSRRNKVLAAAWEKPISDVLRANFSLVGDGRQVFEWDSAADILFYASGRRHCKFAQGHVVLRARQDAVALINDLAANTQEKVEIEVTLNDDESSGFVFAAVPRKRSKAIGRDRYDIATFTKIVSNEKVSPKVAIFSENADATTQLLDSGLGDILASETSLLEELHVTDSPSEKPESHDFKCDKKLMAVIRLPVATAEGLARFKETLEFVFYLVDYISEAVVLRPESTRKLAKAREEAFKEFARMAEQEKQDALAKALAEKRRIELEGVDKMSPEQRRKWEEKDRKKQLKKEQSKRVRRIR